MAAAHTAENVTGVPICAAHVESVPRTGWSPIADAGAMAVAVARPVRWAALRRSQTQPSWGGSLSTRILSGLLAIGGAVLIFLGSWFPYATSKSNGFDLRVIDRESPHNVLWFAAEPVAVMVAAVVIGILLLVRPMPAVLSGVLAGTGVQTALYFVGLVGFYASTDFGSHVTVWPWVAIGGCALLVSGGLVSALVRPGAPAQARSTGPGWYQDPHQPGRLRYWSGSAWTEHTHDQPSQG